MVDERALAYLNLYAVLGSLPQLCELDAEARGLIADKTVSVGISVRGGPQGTLFFDRGVCTVSRRLERCDIKLPFSSCAGFNGMINGTVTPIPAKGFTKIGFLTGRFTRLTDRLTAYLRADAEKLREERFFTVSTTLMLHLITEAIAQLGNEDPVSRSSASYIDDGVIRLSIRNGPATAVEARGHRLTARHEAPDACTSYMEFEDMKIARELFDGRVNSVACVGMGLVRIGGMISQVDNVNRILDRVAVYLA